MADTALISVDDLNRNYVGLIEPEIIGLRHRHLFSESDEFLAEYLEDKGDTPDVYVRQDALLQLWADPDDVAGHEVNYDPEGCKMWPCAVDDLQQVIAGVALLKDHAPGIALTCPVEGKPTDAFGFTFARSFGDSITKDVRDRESSKYLRLAIAYVCMGELPPSSLAIEALSESLPWPVDDAIIEAIKKSAEMRNNATPGM
jgi:hypothetical protein